MNCEGTRARLDDLVDGTLAAADREEVEHHLAVCPRCRQEAEDLRALRERAAALPRSIEPPRDLWIGIEARIDEQKVVHGRFAGGAGGWRRRGLFAAAALVLVVASSGVTALFLRRGTDAPEQSTPSDPVGVAATVAWREFTDAERQYAQVSDSLLQSLEARRDELSPETVRVVEENVKIINQAIAEARAALERDPANAGLANTLTDIYRKKIDFLRAMTRL